MELTLDNFEKLYKEWLDSKVKPKVFITVELGIHKFIDEVRSGGLLYRGKRITTKIKFIRWTPKTIRKQWELCNGTYSSHQYFDKL